MFMAKNCLMFPHHFISFLLPSSVRSRSQLTFICSRQYFLKWNMLWIWNRTEMNIFSFFWDWNGDIRIFYEMFEWKWEALFVKAVYFAYRGWKKGKNITGGGLCVSCMLGMTKQIFILFRLFFFNNAMQKRTTGWGKRFAAFSFSVCFTIYGEISVKWLWRMIKKK